MIPNIAAFRQSNRFGLSRLCLEEAHVDPAKRGQDVSPAGQAMFSSEVPVFVWLLEPEVHSTCPHRRFPWAREAGERHSEFRLIAQSHQDSIWSKSAWGGHIAAMRTPSVPVSGDNPDVPQNQLDQSVQIWPKPAYPPKCPTLVQILSKPAQFGQRRLRPSSAQIRSTPPQTWPDTANTPKISLEALRLFRSLFEGSPLRRAPLSLFLIMRLPRAPQVWLLRERVAAASGLAMTIVVLWLWAAVGRALRLSTPSSPASCSVVVSANSWASF